MSLVQTDWLEKNLSDVKIIDCSWHMPQVKRDGFEEYKNNHIPNAIFFDLDSNSKKDTNLPHMLVEMNIWEKIVSKMGIDKDDKIIIYDNSDVISSCRCWFNFVYFGHDPKLVSVLNGGLKKWYESYNHKIQKAVAKVGHDTDMHKAEDKVYNALPGCCLYERNKVDDTKKVKHQH